MNFIAGEEVKSVRAPPATGSTPDRFRVVELRDSEGDVAWLIKCNPPELLTRQRIYLTKEAAEEAAGVYNEIASRMASEYRRAVT